jgi:hypothetical protein
LLVIHRLVRRIFCACRTGPVEKILRKFVSLLGDLCPLTAISGRGALIRIGRLPLLAIRGSTESAVYDALEAHSVLLRAKMAIPQAVRLELNVTYEAYECTSGGVGGLRM